MTLPTSWKGKVRRFLGHDVWTTELSSLSAMRRFAVGVTRVLQLIFKGFSEDECLLHASALTFATLMSLVPLLAIAFSLLKGLGGGQEVIDRITLAIADMPEEFQTFIANLLHSINETKFAAMGWIGVAVLLFMVVQMLSSIELAFNRVWGVKTSRHLLRKTANYISTLIVVPILLMVGVTIAATFANDAVIARMGSMAFAYRALLRISPLIAVWIALTFLYLFMPNTRVRAVPAIVSGFAGAVLWLLWQKLYIAVQVGVAQFNVFYGTFAAVPIFLAWLYVSWLTILLGAEVAFAIQNFSTYQAEGAAEQASAGARIRLALAMLLDAARAQHSDLPGFQAETFAHEKKVPFRLVNEMVRVLVAAGFLAELAERPNCFVLLKAAEKVPAKGILDAVLQHGADPVLLGLHRLDPAVDHLLQRINGELAATMGTLTLRDLLASSTPPKAG